MKIIHIAPNAPYNEGWTYQENILPKYHLKLGNDVILVTTNLEHSGGKLIEVPCSDFFSADGFRVVRKKQRSIPIPFLYLKEIDIYDLLQKEKPDYVFFHGMISPTILQVVKYKKKTNPLCIIVQDNHLDYNIGFSTKSFRGKVKKLSFRLLFSMTKDYIDKVYGVTPWRVQYAHEVFGVPQQLLDLLIMGGDDEKIHFEKKDEYRNTIRQTYGIHENEFLIVTGGRFDKNKKLTVLMEAVNSLDNVKLLIFGNILEDIKGEFQRLLSDKCIWVGFCSADKAYEYFLSSDLVAFLGQHSVYWEQACACKVPCLFSKWDGMDHINNGGNSIIIDAIDTNTVIKTIKSLLWTKEYFTMKNIAESQLTDIYLYSNIAKKSLEVKNRNNPT